MIRAALVSAVLAVCAAAPAAQAQPLPQPGATHQDIADWLGREGLDAEVRTDGSGAWVASGANGLSWDVNGYDCENDRCSSWQFSAGFLMDRLPDGLLNSWHTERRYLKAFSAPEGDGVAVIVQYDVLVTPGLGWEAMREHLYLFAGTLPEFADHIGFVPLEDAAQAQ